jgi:SNF2 family DNA or RNA helicase
MKVSLMPHQLLGVKWMVQRENEPKMGEAQRIDEENSTESYGKMKKVNTVGGGALLDEMGLGKTIQSIALMVHNRAPKDEAVKVFNHSNTIDITDDVDYRAKGIVETMEA